jgi:monofunctional biosynthetic peptidoglycan transglycosylase
VIPAARPIAAGEVVAEVAAVTPPVETAAAETAEVPGDLPAVANASPQPVPVVTSGRGAEPTAVTVTGTAAFRRHLRTAARLLLGLVAGWVAVVAIQIVAYRWIDPPGSMPMLARTLTGAPYEQNRVALGAISEHLVRAVVVSEDAKFCRHRGVDWAELAAAIEEAEFRAARGASTISMQVAKNLFLWSDRSLLRKALELPIALALDAAWPKERVLEVYLNIAEWGPGIYGAEAAARRYFRKPARALSVREAAVLATALPNPKLRDPRRPDRRHARLAEVVRTRMAAGRDALRCLAGKAAPTRP